MVGNDAWGAAAQVRTANRWYSAAANWNSALTQALLASSTCPPESPLLLMSRLVPAIPNS